MSGTRSTAEIALRPLMIVGAPRSGTTWLQRMLLSDPHCCGGQESHFFVSFGRVVADFDHKAGLERCHGLAAYWRRADLLDHVRRLWTDTVTPCLQARPEADLLIEKTPDHALWIDVIDEILPQSRFIHVIRDSRAVCASLLAAGRASWGRGWAPRSARDAAQRWVRHVEAAERAGDRLGAQRFLRIHYEDLHTDAEAMLETVWKFAGLPAEAAQLAAVIQHGTLPAQREAQSDGMFVGGELADSQAREPEGFFRSGRSESWKQELSWSQRRLIWRHTRGQMQRLGYDRSGRC